MYKKLMNENDKPVNWNCEDEYAKHVPESTTAPPTETTGNYQNTLLVEMMHLQMKLIFLNWFVYHCLLFCYLKI